MAVGIPQDPPADSDGRSHIRRVVTIWAVLSVVFIALAILIAVPWDQTNRQVTADIRLMTADGDPVEVDGNVVQASVAFEVGRPPGTKPGAALNTPLTIAFNAMRLEAGGYRFELEIDGEPTATAPFRAQ